MGDNPMTPQTEWVFYDTNDDHDMQLLAELAEDKGAFDDLNRVIEHRDVIDWYVDEQHPDMLVEYDREFGTLRVLQA